ncbi:serine hydrolase [Mycobacterium sp. CBMA293]|nr:serine hydrolase [Mycolicibacterium sp. CBMA 360]MUL57026.1 serine hydrolase [Mycolicibacterium sp. CBMA 335]MUL70066.1 serine hydrolase [Mycolicibacterium sp. CBMA 311]MUL92114.1 serine hydrolase [Mycolicibacterium sp. CBMA 230]MUM05852.1 serine hydrolase [Mycolicibacterium sp. CBMA 213]MUM10970.1 serine hydrolase [Mycolicibacterium sp. CBMA 293]
MIGVMTAPSPHDERLPDPKDMLTWSQAERVIGFRNNYRMYAGSVFRSGTPRPLQVAATPLTDVTYRFDGQTYHLADYLEHQDATGLLVLKDGQVVCEYLGNGNTAETLWTSRSVAKSVVSTLVGVAAHEGAIASLDDPLTRYDSTLAGTAWDGVSVRQLMQHTSGVQWNEDYTDPGSEFSAMTRYEAGAEVYPAVSNLVRNLKRGNGIEPGQVWSYNSGGAWLLGDLLEKAVGMPLSRYLEQKIWIPCGMAADGVWHSYEGHDTGAHGFNATLGDWGRFGLFVLNDGILPGGEKILPHGWVGDASDWSAVSASPEHRSGAYGYQWWNNELPVDSEMPSAGDSECLWALGIFGQMLAINRSENIVMVQWSTWPMAEPSFSAQPAEAAVMFEAFTTALLVR